MSRRKTTQEFVNDINRINPNISIMSEYRGCKEKVKRNCLLDGYEWEATPKKLLEGRGCPKCGGALNLTNEQFAQRLRDVNPNIISLDPYINARFKIRFKCLICGEVWNQDPNHILHQKTGCPKCKQSKGEKQVEQFLQDGNIKYILQYNIDSTSFTQKRVRVDFFLPELNCIIGYNGKQHYFPVDFGDNDQNKVLEKFNKQIIRDQQLRNFCRDNIKLIEMLYTISYKNIEQYLLKIL